MRKIKQISVRFDDELHKKVKYLLVDIEKSFNEYILELIREDLVRREKEKNKDNLYLSKETRLSLSAETTLCEILYHRE